MKNITVYNIDNILDETGRIMNEEYIQKNIICYIMENIFNKQEILYFYGNSFNIKKNSTLNNKFIKLLPIIRLRLLKIILFRFLDLIIENKKKKTIHIKNNFNIDNIKKLIAYKSISPYEMDSINWLNSTNNIVNIKDLTSSFKNVNDYIYYNNFYYNLNDSRFSRLLINDLIQIIYFMFIELKDNKKYLFIDHGDNYFREFIRKKYINNINNIDDIDKMLVEYNYYYQNQGRAKFIEYNNNIEDIIYYD